MLGLTFPRDEPLRLLCLGAHADDVEIGCGGTILRLLAEHPVASVRWVVFSGEGQRRGEAEAGARCFLGGQRDAAVTVHGFRDGFFPSQHAEIKDAFERLKREYRPSLVLTHYRDDLHQDHRLVSELTYNTFRDHLVWEYEIPKYDGDLGNPNLFSPLSEDVARRKVAALLEHFPSQRSHRWFSAETFLAMLRLRGIGCNAASGFAEAFYCRKAVV
ncbi:MAG TPA: PIG-L deacetylase family protein [Stellaceae bacterium]